MVTQMPAEISEDILNLKEVFQCIRSTKNDEKDLNYHQQMITVQKLCGSLPNLYSKWKYQESHIFVSACNSCRLKNEPPASLEFEARPESESTDSFLIGNPLELEQIADYDLIQDQLTENVTTTQQHARRKRKRGSTLTPLPSEIARLLISDITLEYGHPLPSVWCVAVDSTNPNHILLGIDGEFIHTVDYKETRKPEVDVSLDTLLLKHKTFAPYAQMVTEARCRYDLSQFSCAENSATPDSGSPQISCSSVTIESCWSEVSRTMCNPPDISLAGLIINLVSGQTNSSVYHLYEQLTFLQSLADSMKSGEIRWKDPSAGSKPVTERVEQLIFSSDHLYSSTSNMRVDEENGLKSSSDVQLCQIERRNGLDLSDQLWEILQDCASYSELVQSFQLICDVVNKKSAPSLLVSNSNKNSLSRWIHSRQNPSLCTAPAIEFGGLHALFVLVEVGLERLERDYIHAFMYGFSGLVSADIIESMVSSQHAVVERLQLLHRLHTVLELAALMNGFLHLPHSVIKQTTKSSLNKIRSHDSNQDALLDNKFQLTLPVSYLENVLQMHTPDVWELYISSSDSRIETRLRMTKEEPEHSLPVFQSPRKPLGQTSPEDMESAESFYCLWTVSSRIEAT